MLELSLTSHVLNVLPLSLPSSFPPFLPLPLSESIGFSALSGATPSANYPSLVPHPPSPSISPPPSPPLPPPATSLRTVEDIIAARGVKPTLSPNLNTLAAVEVGVK